MDKFKDFLNAYFWLIFIVFLAAFALLIFGIYGNYRDGAAQREANDLSHHSNVAVQQAAEANRAAGNFEAQRRDEDAFRDAAITPRRRDAQHKSNESAAALEAARQKYKNAKNPPANLHHSAADNCDRLRDLFPDTSFADCRR